VLITGNVASGAGNVTNIVTSTATCPGSTVLLGGGARVASSDGVAANLAHFHLISSYPSSTSVWTAVANSDGFAFPDPVPNIQVTAFALCSQ
jgi:hypothetical protein